MIHPFEIMRASIRSIGANKLRTSLTGLGIMIGVAAVIIMVSLGYGASKRVSDTFSNMGTNLLVVFPGSARSGGVRLGSSTKPTLTLSDWKAILENCTSIEDAAPEVRGSAQVVFGNSNWNTTISGTTNSILNIRNWHLSEGRTFTDSELRSSAKVCIIGETVAKELFGTLNPIGRTIRINKIPVLVIGLLEPKGSTGMGQDQDDIIFVPITTAQKRLFPSPFPQNVDAILVKAKGAEFIDSAEHEVEQLLIKRHKIKDPSQKDFNIRNLQEFMDAAEESTKTMSLLLASVASVSLMVGGIGIMNIMLVTVTERTREIGIRMAIGARTSDILAQFLLEAIFVSLIGGTLGIITGCLGSIVVSHFTSWPAVLSIKSIFLALSFSVSVGVLFGFFPAWKASSLNPIDALRHE
ncbi:ABC transporter permease [Thermovirga lienii]|jgi:putative ABC transport system permease protein|uniref:ABC transporter permease n=1 Tax=Thermovirga lienii TaxID=336261 RepID=UPI000ED1C320|nr:multidrug ABC transporter substrate-binding protein [Thermovirga lienii]